MCTAPHAHAQNDWKCCWRHRKTTRCDPKSAPHTEVYTLLYLRWTCATFLLLRLWGATWCSKWLICAELKICCRMVGQDLGMMRFCLFLTFAWWMQKVFETKFMDTIQLVCFLTFTCLMSKLPILFQSEKDYDKKNKNPYNRLFLP